LVVLLPGEILDCEIWKPAEWDNFACLVGGCHLLIQVCG
jgi:hypothetical protein